MDRSNRQIEPMPPASSSRRFTSSTRSTSRTSLSFASQSSASASTTPTRLTPVVASSAAATTSAAAAQSKQVSPAAVIVPMVLLLVASIGLAWFLIRREQWRAREQGRKPVHFISWPKLVKHRPVQTLAVPDRSSFLNDDAEGRYSLDITEKVVQPPRTLTPPPQRDDAPPKVPPKQPRIKTLRLSTIRAAVRRDPAAWGPKINPELPPAVPRSSDVIEMPLARSRSSSESIKRLEFKAKVGSVPKPKRSPRKPVPRLLPNVKPVSPHSPGSALEALKTATTDATDATFFCRGMPSMLPSPRPAAKTFDKSHLKGPPPRPAPPAETLPSPPAAERIGSTLLVASPIPVAPTSSPSSSIRAETMPKPPASKTRSKASAAALSIRTRSSTPTPKLSMALSRTSMESRPPLPDVVIDSYPTTARSTVVPMRASRADALLQEAFGTVKLQLSPAIQAQKLAEQQAEAKMAAALSSAADAVVSPVEDRDNPFAKTHGRSASEQPSASDAFKVKAAARRSTINLF